MASPDQRARRRAEAARAAAFALLVPIPVCALFALARAALRGPGGDAPLYALIYMGAAAAAAWFAAREAKRRRGLDELASAAWKLSARNSLSPVPDAEASPDVARLAGILRRRSEKIVRQSTRLARRSSQHRQLLDLLEEGVMLLGPENEILLSNAALDRVVRIGEGAHRPQTVEEVIRDGAFLRLLAKARATGEERRLTLVRTEPSQTLDILVKPLARDAGADEPESAGTGPLMGVVLRDITRQTRLENARKEFVGNVGHELRTPLTAIRGYVDTLREGAASDPDLAERFLGVISRHATRLESLIDDLLELARLDEAGGGGKRSLERVSPREVLDGAIEATRHRFESKAIRLVDEARWPLPAVAGLRSPLERVFINLLDNAANYSEPNTTVTLFASEEAETIEFGVRDEGIGIPDEALNRIFERFYRVDKDRSRLAGGTGLGLSIVKNTVQRCRGETRVESKVGKGSTFYVRLRKAEPGQVVPPEPDSAR